MKRFWLVGLLLVLLLPALASAASLTLTWQDMSTNEDGFNVQKKVEACTGAGAFAQLAAVGVNVITYSDLAIVEGNTYAYRVNAYNTAGTSAWSNCADKGVPYTQASAPTGLTVNAATGVLTWTDKTSNETGFGVERKPVACAATGTFAALTTVAANVVTYTDTGGTQGTTYCYRVAAMNPLGNSPYSNTVERLVPLVAPVAPAQLGITLVP